MLLVVAVVDALLGCDQLGNCDLNAECVENIQDSGQYYCRCLNGYDGDGYTCTKVQQYTLPPLPGTHPFVAYDLYLLSSFDGLLLYCQLHPHLVDSLLYILPYFESMDIVNMNVAMIGVYDL